MCGCGEVVCVVSVDGWCVGGVAAVRLAEDVDEEDSLACDVRVDGWRVGEVSTGLFLEEVDEEDAEDWDGQYQPGRDVSSEFDSVEVVVEGECVIGGNGGRVNGGWMA